MKVQEQVTEILASLCSASVADIKTHTQLRHELDMDDMTMVEMSMALEDELSVRVPDCDLDAFRTVGDVVEYIENRA